MNKMKEFLLCFFAAIVVIIVITGGIAIYEGDCMRSTNSEDSSIEIF